MRAGDIGQHRLQALGVRDRPPRDDAHVVDDHPVQDVARREEREAQIGVGELYHGHVRADVGDQVLMGQHHALGLARCPGGIDDRGDIPGLDIV